MNCKQRGNRFLSIVLALAMVAFVNVPMIAWGDDEPVEPPQSGDIAQVVIAPDDNSQASDDGAETQTDPAPVPNVTDDPNAAADANDVIVADPDLAATTDEGTTTQADTDANPVAEAAPAVDTPVAKIEGGDSYTSLKEAVDAATNGQTVTMLDNVTIDASTTPTISKSYSTLNNKSITLDLAGKTVTFDMSRLELSNNHKNGVDFFFIAPGGGLTITDSGSGGTITAVAPSTKYSLRPLINNYGGTFTLTGGTIKGVKNVYYLVCTDTPGTQTTITGGTLDNQWGDWTDGGICLSSNGGAENAEYKIDISGGTLKGGEQTLYLPSAGITNITGGTFEGTARAVEIRAGELNVTGGTFKATTPRVDDATAGSGKTGDYTGALAAVIPEKGFQYTGSIKIDVSGGTFTADAGDAIVVVNEQTSNPLYTVKTDISGGTFTGGMNIGATVSESGTDSLSITGGTFSSDPSKYVAENHQVKNVNDTYEVSPMPAVAKIGEAEYTSLKAAAEAAKAGDTVTLVADTESTPVSFATNVTLDLGGKTLKIAGGESSDKFGLQFISGGDNTLQNGTVIDTRSNGNQVGNRRVVMVSGGTTNLTTQDVKIQSYKPDSINDYNYLLFIGSDKEHVAKNVVLGSGTELSELENSAHTVDTTAGTIGVNVIGSSFKDPASAINNVSLTVSEGVTINTTGFAICGNGNCHGTKIVVNGGTVKSKKTTAIYHPQAGELTINGGSIEGISGIEVRAGELNVSDGASIKGTGGQSNGPNPNGPTTSGVGIAVAQHTTRQPIKVNISGGTISGKCALFESNPQSNPAEDIAKVKLAVSGGLFSTINGGTQAIYSGWHENFITGGTFRTVVDTKYYDENIYSQNAQDAVDAPGAVVPHAYALSYALDGGTLADGVTNPISYTYFAEDFTLINPTKTGYTFAGWTGTNIDKPSKSVTITKGSKGDRSYTATWTANEASIVFEENGGPAVSDIVGKTGDPVTASLPQMTREGYAFVGWYADKTLATPVTQLPATLPGGTTTYYAKWNATPLPDSETEIQVEVPRPSEGDSSYATVPSDTVTAAAEQAQGALATIEAGDVPAGMSEADAKAVAGLVKSAAPNDTVSVVVSLKFEEKAKDAIDSDEQAAIKGVSENGEKVSLYLDLSVAMTVKVSDASGVKDQKTVSLTEVSEPLLFEVHVDPSVIKDKAVRLAHVHGDTTEIINPESVDRESGTISFYASSFSTYALLTSETVTVTFESNGGTAIDPQTLKFGEKAAKPTDPTREGFVFGGWFSDEALGKAYDFAAPVESSVTLYAKWTTAGAQNSTIKKLAATGDTTGTLVTGAVALTAIAGAALGLAALRRRRSR